MASNKGMAKRSAPEGAKTDENPTSKRRKLPDSLKKHSDLPTQSFFENKTIYILKAGIEKARIQIFKTQLEKFGGTFADTYDSSCDYVVVEDKMEVDRFCRLLKLDSLPGSFCPVVKSTWLSACFRQKSVLNASDYELNIETYFSDQKLPSSDDSNHDNLDNDATTNQVDKDSKSNFKRAGVMWRAHKAKKESESDEDSAGSGYALSDDEGTTAAPARLTVSDASTSERKNMPTGSWICAQSSKNKNVNLNQHITEKLQEMVKNYESTNDKWRAFGYQKAIQALRKYPKEITTWEQARSLPGVGTRLADKIWEIAESGELRKLNEFQSNEEVQLMKTFIDVWGAGPHTARVWLQQGFRSLDDVKAKANLTHQQTIGLKHYDDIKERMPREEAGEIEQVVRAVAESLQPGVIAQACGSYRRGRPTCGDVDVLVTHPDGKSHKGMFAKLLAKLKEQGFLTDDLVTAEDSGNQKKYLGVCKLAGENRKHRRLDIIVVPYDEYACALVYFTGSAHFNRSLRHLAKKKGMSLSEHSLNTGVVRKGGEKVYEGTALSTPTEESVLLQLGVPYRPPEERDH